MKRYCLKLVTSALTMDDVYYWTIAGWSKEHPIAFWENETQALNRFSIEKSRPSFHAYKITIECLDDEQFFETQAAQNHSSPPQPVATHPPQQNQAMHPSQVGRNMAARVDEQMFSAQYGHNEDIIDDPETEEGWEFEDDLPDESEAEREEIV